MISRTRPDACLSDFALDRRLGGEVDPVEETLAREHIASCVRCGRRWVALCSERDAFAGKVPAPNFRVQPVQAWRRRSLVAGLGVLAALAATLVLLRVPDEVGIGTKGNAWRIGFYVSHAGVVREGVPGERVEPGDALRFTYHATDSRYVAVLSVDGARRVSKYYPASGAATREEPGAAVALPLSTVLDDALGDEKIYGVGCLRPFDVEALRQALERAPERPPAVPEGCRVDTLVLRKELPGRP